MIRTSRRPRTRLLGNPFIGGFTDIDREGTNLMIGDSELLDDIFNDDSPEHIKLLCSMSAHAAFTDVVVSARYKEKSNGNVKTLSYHLYDGSSLNMTGFVSKLSITALDILPEFGTPDSRWQRYISENNVIYTKHFQTQASSTNVENFVDHDAQETGIIHTKSRAHSFAGSYFSGIKLADIQPYLFYVGTGYQAKPYISIISASDALRLRKVTLAPGVSDDSLSTLEDDICNGSIQLSIPDCNTTYKSVAAIKETLTSDIFQITFRKEAGDG
ncbi:MAG: hypothetical protein LBR78_00770 [Holosporales bacterium]|jgi:hypothetical protein|nr:hypothetical protein [Holosporales bacterium]